VPGDDAIAGSDLHVAFVRAVMIGREGLHRDVLLAMFERAGADDCVSFISTGNVSFRAEPGGVSAIVEQVEDDLEQLLGRATPVFVRSLGELATLLASDPFADPPVDAVRGCEVSFFRSAVPDHLDLPMSASNGDWVVFGTGPREVYSVTRERSDRQPSSPGGVIERTAGEPITTRALGTLERIAAKLVDLA
jgi:uncharacterized protein (DUF1697 family)